MSEVIYSWMRREMVKKKKCMLLEIKHFKNNFGLKPFWIIARSQFLKTSKTLKNKNVLLNYCHNC